MNQIIRVLNQSRTRECVSESGRVVPRSRAAKLAKWFLDKTDHSILVETYDSVVEYHDIDIGGVREILNSILNQSDWIKLTGGEIDRVVMGPKIFRDVLGEVSNPFTMQVPVTVGTPREGYKVYGIDVQVIPWIDGFAVIPKKNG